jgi:hypothetical protein
MTALLTRLALREYARRPLNVTLLVLVPAVFVALTAGAIADFAEALGGTGGAGTIEAASAGWAASILAGVGGCFHVAASRAPDRRLAAATGATAQVVLARIASALVLALVASAGALVALWLRTGIDDVPRAVGATLLFALIYLGIGVTVGALVRSELNGSVLIVFIWLYDVFLSPAMGIDVTALRIFPLHFPTVVVTDAVSGHAGPFGDLGISLIWAAGALAVGLLALMATTRPARTAAVKAPGADARLRAALRYDFREYRRNVLLWVLLVGLPIAFVNVARAVTPDDPAPLELAEDGMRAVRMLPMSDLHGAIMVPIAVAVLSGLAGLFVAVGSAEGDRRLVISGFRTGEVLAARLGVVAFAAMLTTAVTLTVTALGFTVENWAVFIAANVLVALTYGMIGVLLGPVFGRLGGLYLMLTLPFIDVGIAQDPMFAAAPPGWARFLPAHGAVRMMLDGAFTSGFDEPGALLLALAWLAAVGAAAVAVFARLAAPSRE